MLLACPKCRESFEGSLFRPPHMRHARCCPSCGHRARPSAFHPPQPATAPALPAADGQPAPDAADDGELHARLCRRLGRITRVVMLGVVTAAAADVVLAANVLRALVRLWSPS